MFKNDENCSVATTCVVFREELLTRLQHLGNNTHQRTIFKCCRYPFLISQLFIHFISSTVCSFFDLHIDPEPRWKGLFKPDTDTKAYDGGQTTMSNSRRDEDSDSPKRRVRYTR